jgi:hypothetical protein
MLYCRLGVNIWQPYSEVTDALMGWADRAVNGGRKNIGQTVIDAVLKEHADARQLAIDLRL